MTKQKTTPHAPPKGEMEKRAVVAGEQEKQAAAKALEDIKKSKARESKS